MNEAKIKKIKRTVKGNFDQSPAEYQSFEDRYGFFRRLTAILINRMELPVTADILDVGCGTGASSLQIVNALPESRVWGLDNSVAMLDAARTRNGESDRLTFVEGDAANLTKYFQIQFDAIIYSASIFLVPDYRESLGQACSLLKTGGSVGLTFMDGLYDFDGNNLFEVAERTAKQGVSLKKVVNWSEFEAFFAQHAPWHRSWIEDFQLPRSQLREFYSIPAVSAGIFPGIEYSDRVKKVGRLFDNMPKKQILTRWRIMIGRKEG